jgi:cellulose synthase/poly-beta-1,6-N-acetylglucosamine synthase-like glycosyltransferase
MSLADAPVLFTSPQGQVGRACAFVVARPLADNGSLGEKLEAILRFPELDNWAPVLDRLDLPGLSRTHIATEARVNGVTFFQQLLASGLVDETGVCRALADELGVSFLEKVDPAKVVAGDRHCLTLLALRSGTAQMGIVHKGRLNLLLAPDRLDIAAMKDRLRRAPGLAERLMLAPPFALRKALFERARSMLAMHATGHLWEAFADCSARVVISAWQGFFLGTLAISLLVGLVSVPTETFFVMHLFFTTFFLACVGLRTAAIPSAGLVSPFIPKSFAAEEMPVYSVLVALYQEAEMIPELLVALGNIVWPRSKLEIKLVCEEDDHATLAAIKAHPLRPAVEVIEVPARGPRTKPKALAYALPATSGEYVVLYDAEDRPHPLQLLEAWQRLQASGPEVACVQAPLEISNGEQTLISRLFAFEYAALFRGMLPWLSARRLLLPLGGTSNHFRRSVLDEVGSWDPYNVTEDADMGLRLARFGYRTETITSPTYEDGPEDLKTWRPQRTRWFKGWMQTWLVHMRNPLRLQREIGFRSFAIVQTLVAGMLVSALAHPILVVSGVWLAVDLALERTLSTYRSVLLLFDIVSISAGYLSFLLLGRQAIGKDDRAGFWRVVLFTPVYWIMMSVAAWWAVVEIIRRPHHWAKTTHHRSQRQCRGTGL